MQYLTQNKVALSSGSLTPSRFQQLGIMFGFHGKTLDLEDQSIKANMTQVVSIVCTVNFALSPEVSSKKY